MTEEELDSMLEKDVAYLQRNIAPDDIYLFTQNTLLATYLLAHELMHAVGKENFELLPKITRRVVTNIAVFKRNQEQEIDVKIDLNTYWDES